MLLRSELPDHPPREMQPLLRGVQLLLLREELLDRQLRDMEHPYGGDLPEDPRKELRVQPPREMEMQHFPGGVLPEVLRE